MDYGSVGQNSLWVFIGHINFFLCVFSQQRNNTYPKRTKFLVKYGLKENNFEMQGYLLKVEISVRGHEMFCYQKDINT